MTLGRQSHQFNEVANDEPLFRVQMAAFVAPASRPALVRQAYKWGARNRETDVLSVLGDAPMMTGVTLPTFLPESC
jgi:hypothetical protein